VNKVLEVLKAQWVAFSLLAAVLVVLPLSWYFSTTMRASQLTKLQTEIGADAKELGNPRVNYSVAPLIAGGPTVEESAVPNEVLTAYFKAARDRQQEQAASLFQEALTMNAGKRVSADGTVQTLVPGLLPDPSETEIDVKRFQMIRAFTEDAPRRLIERARAGMPPDRDVIARELGEQLTTMTRAKLPPGKADPALLSDADRAEIRAKLMGLRVDRYRNVASALNFYADASIFGVPAAQAEGGALPSMATCFDWQMQYYAWEDVVSAILTANEAARAGGVPAAVVKRVEFIGAYSTFVSNAPLAPSGASGEPVPETPRTGPETSPEGGVMPLKYEVSVTGRVSGPGSGQHLYDLRTVDVRVIVSAKNLPQFLDALAQTNFISVLDVDIQSVDSNDELRKGFFYGDEAVVRASIKLETVWLRDWTMKIMPLEVRVALGVPEPAGSTPPADPNAPAVPAAPAPAGGTPGNRAPSAG